MSKPYCGSGNIPKGSKNGTMKECAELNQVRLYGLNKIDRKTFDNVKMKKSLPETRDNLIIELVKNRGLFRTHSKRATDSKDSKVRSESKKIADNAEKMIKKVSAKLKKLEVKPKVKTKIKPKVKLDKDFEKLKKLEAKKPKKKIKTKIKPKVKLDKDFKKLKKLNDKLDRPTKMLNKKSRKIK